MEINSQKATNKEQSKIPPFLKSNKMKLGGEENNNILIPKNDSNLATNEDTKERVKFLFPDMSPKDINQVLERAEYNIEKTIDLLNELKQEQNKNLGNKNFVSREGKKAKKRNYLELTQKNEDRDSPNIQNIINNNTENNNDIKTNDNNTKNNFKEKEENSKIIDSKEKNKKINEVIINNIDEEKKNLINKQMDYLLEKFDKMKDKSELKKLLIEVGFPLKNEDSEKDKENLQKILDDKMKENKHLKDTIVKLYKNYEKARQEVEKKEDLIEEKTNTLNNLIGVEIEQKIRKEYYEKELKDYEKSLNNNNNYFKGPKEGY